MRSCTGDAFQPLACFALLVTLVGSVPAHASLIGRDVSVARANNFSGSYHSAAVQRRSRTGSCSAVTGAG